MSFKKKNFKNVKLFLNNMEAGTRLCYNVPGKEMARNFDIFGLFRGCQLLFMVFKIIYKYNVSMVIYVKLFIFYTSIYVCRYYDIEISIIPDVQAITILL